MPSSRSRQDDLRALIERPFAHRGLQGSGRIENSRAAFEAAIERGHGIELDVQASADGVAMVFHDWSLGRLTVAGGSVDARACEDLQRITLIGSEETVPTLAEVLTLIAGRAPLLVEIKSKRRPSLSLCRSVAAAFGGYSGAVAIMSFNPRVVRWFRRHQPHVLRGLVVTEENRRGWRGWALRRLASLWSRPDFLAYDVRDLPSPFTGAARAGGMPVLTWTVRTAEQRVVAADHADQIIYEDLP